MSPGETVSGATKCSFGNGICIRMGFSNQAVPRGASNRVQHSGGMGCGWVGFSQAGGCSIHKDELSQGSPEGRGFSGWDTTCRRGESQHSEGLQACDWTPQGGMVFGRHWTVLRGLPRTGTQHSEGLGYCCIELGVSRLKGVEVF